MTRQFLPLTLALSLFTAQPAQAAPPGSLVVTQRQVDASGGDFEKAVKAAAVGKLKRAGDNWHVYFVAYLKKAPGAEEVNVVFYEAGAKGREPVNHYPLRTKATAKILMSDVEIKPEDGFKVGGKYLMKITRLIGGREEVYASTTVELAE